MLGQIIPQQNIFETMKPNTKAEPINQYNNISIKDGGSTNAKSSFEAKEEHF
jgi:hypothetical protein